MLDTLSILVKLLDVDDDEMLPLMLLLLLNIAAAGDGGGAAGTVTNDSTTASPLTPILSIGFTNNMSDPKAASKPSSKKRSKLGGKASRLLTKLDATRLRRNLNTIDAC